MKKMWGGAFSQEQDSLAEEFGRSIESDLDFWLEDVQCSIAHAQMLGETGIVAKQDAAKIVRGLKQILKDGPDKLPRNVEDVHTAIEVRLKEIIGAPAGMLHTARSRNDQVATSTRLVLRKRAALIQSEIKRLQAVIITVASKHQKCVMPGTTHQQHAQPVTLAFHLLAHFWAMQRHGWRFQRLLEMIGTCPLGSGALAGTSLPIDRCSTAKRLGFEAPTRSALDATSDRSYVLDALHCCSLVMLDLSRISQELAVWSMPEFGWVALPDSLTTGSSMMPQKRNPDMAELVRGRAGKAIGNYVALSTTMKGLMLGYNRDTQDDKPPLFESLSLVERSLPLVGKMLEGAVWNTKRMSDSTRADFSTATDLADLLAQKGIPFRRAHETVGKVVKHCREMEIGLEALSVSQFKKMGVSVTQQEIERLKPDVSASVKESMGGTGQRAVNDQLKSAQKTHRKPGFEHTQ